MKVLSDRLQQLRKMEMQVIKYMQAQLENFIFNDREQ